MPAGIKIKDVVVGSGDLVERGKVAVAHVRGVLRRGDEIFDTHKFGCPAVIDLERREHVAGLRKGILGMRVGGKRDLVVSPHLAYGDKACGGIPANAVVRFEVELLAVRERGALNPEVYPPGKHVYVFHPGEAAQNVARWQFGCYEGGKSGVIITSAIEKDSWRHARIKQLELEITPEETSEIVRSIQNTFAEYPDECLNNDQLWSDASEKGNGITRDRENNTLMVTIGLQERGAWLVYGSLRETSPVLLMSRFYQIITRAVAPYLDNVSN